MGVGRIEPAEPDHLQHTSDRSDDYTEALTMEQTDSTNGEVDSAVSAYSMCATLPFIRKLQLR